MEAQARVTVVDGIKVKADRDQAKRLVSGFSETEKRRLINIQRAIDERRLLVTRYVAEGYNTPIRRDIRPTHVWISDETGRLCVKAYCHWAGGFRTFHVDRFTYLALGEEVGPQDVTEGNAWLYPSGYNVVSAEPFQQSANPRVIAKYLASGSWSTTQFSGVLVNETVH